MVGFRDAKSKAAKSLIHRRGSASRELAMRTACGSRGNGFRVTSGRRASRARLLGAITLLLGGVLSVLSLEVPAAEAAPPAIAAVSTGGFQTCALTSTGGVECWGAGSTTVPVAVSGLSSGVIAITSGGTFACALTTAGGVECWGDNSYGQLGNGTATDSSVPVAVSGLSSGVSAISAGNAQTCALQAGGGVECWGDNFAGQLGNGTTTGSLVPVAVSGLSSGVSAISAGSNYTCALTSAGGVECWGDNTYGQLGNGTTTDSSVPVAVSGLSSAASAISAGGNHTCALTTAEGVQCWGSNSSGQLGDGTTTNRYVPVAVSGLSNGVSAVSVGQNHTCALTSDGGVECWGSNSSGQLGNGTATDSSVPVAVSGLSSGVSAIATGGDNTCALPSTGGVECWGYNFYGELGNGTTTGSSVPVASLVENFDTVSFNSEGGSPAGPLTNLDGTLVTLPGAPSYSGYTFTGWNTAPDGSGANYSAGANYTLSGSLSLYAQWSLNTPPVNTTAVVLPSNGATLSGSQWLDATTSSGATKVVYWLWQGPDGVEIATATPTNYGWLANWKTTTEPNGTYTLNSVATFAGGVDVTSSGITVTVNNPGPTTTVVLPSNGATLSGSQWLDTIAPQGVTRVQYRGDGGNPHQFVHRERHPHHLWVVGGLEHHDRAQLDLHAQQHRYLFRWLRCHKSHNSDRQQLATDDHRRITVERLHPVGERMARRQRVCRGDFGQLRDQRGSEQPRRHADLWLDAHPLRLDRSVELRIRARRQLHASERRLLRRRGERHEPRDHDHRRQLDPGWVQYAGPGRPGH